MSDALATSNQPALWAAFWDQNRKGYALLPEDVKEEIANIGAVVIVHAIRDGETKFGPTWFTDIAYGVDMWTFAQSHNQLRDRTLLALKDFLALNGPMPATIEAFSTASGTGYDLAQPSQEALTAFFGANVTTGEIEAPY
jgi:hypothetical protein